MNKLEELIKSAEVSSWLTDGLDGNEMTKIGMLGLISAKIERKRKEMNMNQKEFAAFMEVSQEMVSKWESGEYNFSINTLQDICHKLNLEFKPEI